MIIAMVCDFLGEENNGTTIFCYNLIEWLTRHGHSVNIICPDKDKSDINSCFIVPQKKHLTSIEKRFANQGLVFAKPKRSVIRKAVLGTDGVLIITPFSLGKYCYKIRFGAPHSCNGDFSMSGRFAYSSYSNWFQR